MNVLANHEIRYIYDRPSQESGMLKDNRVIAAFDSIHRHVIREKVQVGQTLSADEEMEMVEQTELVVETYKDRESCLVMDDDKYHHEVCKKEIVPRYKQAL